MPRRVVRAALFVFGLPNRRRGVVPRSDRAMNILSRCHPVQIAATIVAFVTVEVVDLGTFGAASRHESLRDESVNAYTSLKFEVTQFDV